MYVGAIRKALDDVKKRMRMRTINRRFARTRDFPSGPIFLDRLLSYFTRREQFRSDRYLNQRDCNIFRKTVLLVDKIEKSSRKKSSSKDDRSIQLVFFAKETCDHRERCSSSARKQILK